MITRRNPAEQRVFLPTNGCLTRTREQGRHVQWSSVVRNSRHEPVTLVRDFDVRSEVKSLSEDVLRLTVVPEPVVDQQPGAWLECQDPRVADCSELADM